MAVAIIALPWSAYSRPSAAVGALAAYLGQHEPGITVECFHAFIEVAFEIGTRLYGMISQQSYELGELLYAQIVYPEKRASVREHFVELTEDWRFDDASVFSPVLFGASPSADTAFDVLTTVLEAHLDQTAARLAGRFTVVALTTCFGQLFANLSLADRIKRIAPSTHIVIGGSTVSSEVGPSLLREYPQLDSIVQGEGETPLLALVRAVVSGSTIPDETPGVLTRTNLGRYPSGVPFSETASMDDLPLPDYESYARAANERGILWVLPVEGSRGCWWDRSRRTGNPKATCYFCNLNVQWSGYREKSVGRLCREVDELSRRYENTALFFLDNIIRTRGVTELAEGIQALRRDFYIFYEMRANVSPRELLSLHGAGVRSVQFGIEGLSSSLLERVGKGTTTIQNLQAMKACYELGISNGANLIVDFPGSTQQEVEETASNVLNYALPYQPLDIAPFFLGVGATVETLAEQFPISNIRNGDVYRRGLPDAVYARLRLFDRSFDLTGTPADWSSVRDAVRLWRHVRAMADSTPLRHVLCYSDGGSFLRIFDGRTGEARITLLSRVERDLYLYCLESRSWNEIVRRFVTPGTLSDASVSALLEQWVERRLMFREANRYLGLAPALAPDFAARRIREAALADDAMRSSRPPGRALPLAVVD